MIVKWIIATQAPLNADFACCKTHYYTKAGEAIRKKAAYITLKSVILQINI